MNTHTLLATLGLATLLATTAASAQTSSSTYSCVDVPHIHAPSTHECTYSSPTYTSTQSCGWVEPLHRAREYRCNDTSTVIRPGSISPDAVSIVRGR